MEDLCRKTVLEEIRRYAQQVVLPYQNSDDLYFPPLTRLVIFQTLEHQEHLLKIF